ncbi:MAG: hypothetical protein AB1391_01875 [Candidatus Micrarchaeota archaeon]
MKLNSSIPLTFANVEEILKAREKDGELGYEQNQTKEYVEKFSRCTKKEAEKLVEKLMENKKITRAVAVIIVNISPKYAETIKTIALKDKIELNDEEVEEIIKLFK